jgi:hypothetical protein
MKPFTSIFRWRQRLERIRKRPGRSLAMSFASLESRALLTIVGPLASATVGTITTLSPLPNPGGSFQSPGYLNFTPSSNGSEADWNHPGGGPGSPQGSTSDRSKNHVALSEADVTANGVSTAEFALANAGDSEVFVRYGNQLLVLDSSQGIDQPQSVELAFLNNNGTSDASNPYPDLIVANTGGNNVLVFPGLAGGRFGPALNGVQGFTVGQNPVSVTVADINSDGIPDLLVANQGSNDISILQGQQSSGNWISNSVQTIPVGGQDSNSAPVKIIYKDDNSDGMGDLFVANSGSNSVYVYQGLGNGAFDTTDPTIFNVGIDPQDMVVGQFDRRPQLDLVTVNSGSDNLTLIDGILTSNPTTQTISSGGAMPDAAIAFPTGNGMMDLVVANSGDGRLALLQAGNSGLQLAGIITPSNLPAPTSLIPGSYDGNAIDFIAATAGQDAAQLLSFDLGISSTYLPTPVSTSNAASGTDSDLIAGLMPFGDSSLELIAVFSVGSLDLSNLDDESSLREPSSITALYTPTEAQGSGTETTSDVSTDAQEPEKTEAEPEQASPTKVLGFMMGIGEKLVALQPRPIEALGKADQLNPNLDGSIEQIARLERGIQDEADDPDTRSHQGSVDEAIRIQGETFDNDSSAIDNDSSTDPANRLDPAQSLDGIPTSTMEGRFETIPLVSSVVLISTRLILKASPPRPPSFRKGRRFRISLAKPEAAPPRPGS